MFCDLIQRRGHTHIRVNARPIYAQNRHARKQKSNTNAVRSLLGSVTSAQRRTITYRQTQRGDPTSAPPLSFTL
jgi:hypothetical protein